MVEFSWIGLNVCGNCESQCPSCAADTAASPSELTLLQSPANTRELALSFILLGA